MPVQGCGDAKVSTTCKASKSTISWLDQIESYYEYISSLLMNPFSALKLSKHVERKMEGSVDDR